MSDIQAFLELLNSAPESIEFEQVMALIANNYDYQATEFSNGLGDAKMINQAGTNEGSCKIFAFALLHDLTQAQTLSCFGDYYRIDVLQHPENQGHQNIRNFMRDGWAGIEFSGSALTERKAEHK